MSEKFENQPYKPSEEEIKKAEEMVIEKQLSGEKEISIPVLRMHDKREKGEFRIYPEDEGNFVSIGRLHTFDSEEKLKKQIRPLRKEYKDFGIPFSINNSDSYAINRPIWEEGETIPAGFILVWEINDNIIDWGKAEENLLIEKYTGPSASYSGETILVPKKNK